MATSEDAGICCTWCGNSFSNPKNSLRKRQVIWIRKTIRIAGDIIRVHGSVDATCNDKLNTMQIASLAS